MPNTRDKLRRGQLSSSCSLAAMSRLTYDSYCEPKGLIIYRLHADAIVIVEVFAKKIAQTPQSVLETCRKRLKEYDDATK